MNFGYYFGKIVLYLFDRVLNTVLPYEFTNSGYDFTMFVLN